MRCCRGEVRRAAESVDGVYDDGTPPFVELPPGDRVAPRELGAAVVEGVWPGERVKLVVVSTEVVVPADVVPTARGGVSPGALIVDEAPLVEPSCTTSYCCCSRCMLALPRWQAAPSRSSRIGAISFGGMVANQVARCVPRIGSNGAPFLPLRQRRNRSPATDVEQIVPMWYGFAPFDRRPCSKSRNSPTTDCSPASISPANRARWSPRGKL